MASRGNRNSLVIATKYSLPMIPDQKDEKGCVTKVTFCGNQKNKKI